MLAPKSHPHLLHASDTLLIVIDMQEPFLRTIHESERLLHNVTTLVQGMNILRVPVIASTQNAERMGGIISSLKPMLPALLPPFDKMTFSGYATPAFASEVQRSGRRQIVLCGVETHICVSQTAHHLLHAGFQVHVATDAVSSRTEANWRLGLDRMRQAGTLVTSVETALYELMYEAGTPEFKQILNLIK